MILWSDNKRLNRFVLLFLTTCKGWYVVGVRTPPPPREGLFVINFMPFTQGL